MSNLFKPILQSEREVFAELFSRISPGLSLKLREIRPPSHLAMSNLPTSLPPHSCLKYNNNIMKTSEKIRRADHAGSWYSDDK